MKSHRLHILADQGDISELLGHRRSSQLVLKRGKGSLLSADLVILHPRDTLCYCGIDLLCCETIEGKGRVQRRQTLDVLNRIFWCVIPKNTDDPGATVTSLTLVALVTLMVLFQMSACVQSCPPPLQKDEAADPA